MGVLDSQIAAVTAAETAYGAAVTQTTNDTAIVDAAKSALTAAEATVANDQSSQHTAAIAYNSALTDLIAAAKAAILPVV